MKNKVIKVLYGDLFNGNLKDEEVAYFDDQLGEGIELVREVNSADFSILIGGSITETQLRQSKTLEACIIPWAGIPQSYHDLLMLDEFKHIMPHNCHYHHKLVSEYAFAMMLAVAKDLGRKDRNLRRGNWLPRYQNSRAMVLRGKTALVMGYGAIGGEIGRLCQAIGMQVLATRQSVQEPTDQNGATVYPMDALSQLLSQCDVLINALPLTPETEGLIGVKQLAQLKSSALIINIGRAKTFDEHALYEALQTDSIRGMAFDVWYNYPSDERSRAMTFPANYPFHELDNVLMSPHHSASLADREDIYYRLDALAAMLNTYAESGKLPNRVDLERGY